MTTVIAAMRETDSAILFAADSGGVDGPAGLRVLIPDKLKRHPQRSMAWATAGNDAVGQRFTRWMLTANPEQWSGFRDQAVTELARLNGWQLELKRTAGRPQRPEDVATALICGWLDGPEIIELSDDGMETSYLSDGFYAIGSGYPYAMAAHRALAEMGLEPLELLRRAMTVAATIAPKCDPPIHFWRVSRDGIEVLS